MARYAVGDRVLVRSDLEYRRSYWMDGRTYRDSVVLSMMDLCGQVVTIKSVGICYHIEECELNWTDEMFAGYAPEFINEEVDIDYGELSLLLI